jgi:hypothetical protein
VSSLHVGHLGHAGCTRGLNDIKYKKSAVCSFTIDERLILGDLIASRYKTSKAVPSVKALLPHR